MIKGFPDHIFQSWISTRWCNPGVTVKVFSGYSNQQALARTTIECVHLPLDLLFRDNGESVGLEKYCHTGPKILSHEPIDVFV
ncbi:MAG: hypothetical protein D6690_02580 [Nitrospirae bacterium]|nr:MAG: hypothetical protein D6690_02580 [Nitrospirota bacterium]